jgi:four helix bundle protein
MDGFTHEKLDAYRVSVEFSSVAERIAEGLPRGRSYLADQLRRASTSITFNIAEGAGEFAPRDKARFYRIARRSASECAAILDTCHAITGVEKAPLQSGRALLVRLAALTTGLILKQLELSAEADRVADRGTGARARGPDSDSDSDSDTSGSDSGR